MGIKKQIFTSLTYRDLHNICVCVWSELIPFFITIIEIIILFTLIFGVDLPFMKRNKKETEEIIIISLHVLKQKLKKWIFLEKSREFARS